MAAPRFLLKETINSGEEVRHIRQRTASNLLGSQALPARN